jgi:hypothetical protein
MGIYGKDDDDNHHRDDDNHHQGKRPQLIYFIPYKRRKL